MEKTLVIPSSFDMACSNKENDNLDNILAMKYFRFDHLYLENDFGYTFYILPLQPLLSQIKIVIITYTCSYICVVIHICSITYGIYMSQKTIQLTDHNMIRENIKVLQELEFIVIEELGSDTNPAKIGMYMKLLWGNKK